MRVKNQSESVSNDATQQSVHLTGGILRHFRTFSTPEHAASRQSCSWSFIHARPPASNANRWAVRWLYTHRRIIKLEQYEQR